MLLTLILLPIATAFLMVFSSTRIQYLLSAAVLAIGSYLSISLFMSAEGASFHLSLLLNTLIIASDVVLLLYFLYQGKKFKSPKVIVLAAAQLLLYGYAEYAAPSGGSAEIIVDELSRFMFLIINIVGGIIVLYAVRYMEAEAATVLKKTPFYCRVTPVSLCDECDRLR
jgi:ech hydrogenase subunit A